MRFQPFIYKMTIQGFGFYISLSVLPNVCFCANSSTASDDRGVQTVAYVINFHDFLRSGNFGCILTNAVDLTNISYCFQNLTCISRTYMRKMYEKQKVNRVM